MHLVKLQTGHYAPFDDKDYEESKKIPVGDIIKGVKSRNWKFHKKGFALLNLGFENQEKCPVFEVYRKVITIRAGYFDETPTKDGEVYYIAKSLALENMSAESFEQWFEATLNVIANDLGNAPDEVRAEIAGFYD